jgi:N-glycosylase/DNA lyase
MPGAPEKMSDRRPSTLFEVTDYDLAATLTSGQAFRWEFRDGWWEGVVRGRWVRLRQEPAGIAAEAAAPVSDWRWLSEYLQVEVDLAAVTATFPKDEPMSRALRACRGLRLLRQEPWECLASFILSSSKQIVQIRQIVAELCRRFGEPVQSASSGAPCFAFPTFERLASVSESDLRACKMGFRAPYLGQTARRLAEGRPALEELARGTHEEAREALLELPGVGPKIADCVLLFAHGFPGAFPVDVWVGKALSRLYFRGRTVNLERLRRFAAGYFGPHGGYAQQYLFHHIRLEEGRASDKLLISNC